VTKLKGDPKKWLKGISLVENRQTRVMNNERPIKLTNGITTAPVQLNAFHS